MLFKEIAVRSDEKEMFIDITPQVRTFIQENEIKDGKLTIFIPHTTAAVTINENTDPDVPSDIIFALHKLVPPHPEFRHLEGNSAAHTKTALIGCCQNVLVRSGKLLLGTWQGIFFCEFDGPRNRKAILGIQE
jgi:secondary thiamine-phosphate synthase enzyme